MGFYLELKRPNESNEFTEFGVPMVFWLLWAIAAFALICMGMAAHVFLGDLLESGAWYDYLLVGGIYAFIPVHLFLGFKLAFVRRFVRMEPDQLIVGFRVLGRELARSYGRQTVNSIALINQKTSPNRAQTEHDNDAYYFRGHWRVLATLKSGKRVTIDRHTEKGMLRQIFRDLEEWLERA